MKSPFLSIVIAGADNAALAAFTKFDKLHDFGEHGQFSFDLFEGGSGSESAAVKDPEQVLDGGLGFGTETVTAQADAVV